MPFVIKGCGSHSLRQERESVCGKFEGQPHRLFPEGKMTALKDVKWCYTFHILHVATWLKNKKRSRDRFLNNPKRKKKKMRRNKKGKNKGPPNPS